MATTDPADVLSCEVTFGDSETATRIERAVDESDLDTVEAFVREGALRLVGEILDEDGQFPCPHDDCDCTFATVRERRGHLGSSEHALDVPEGEFWCGYCGYGPTTWRGVNAHHGQSAHDGPPVRLDAEPEQADLLAPDDIPDHKDPELLSRLYEEHNGNYTAMCRAHDFDVTPGRVRHYLVEFGIHEPTPQGPSEDGEGPQYRDPEWLQERYQAAGGNVSEMHRRLDIDVPYRTLLKNLKRLGIHDPARSSEAPADPDEGRPGSDERDSEDGRDGTEQPVSRDADETTETAVDTDAGADTDEDPSHGRSGAESQSREEHLAALGVDDPAAVDGFQDLATPDWLYEGSFYQGVEMAADVDELAEVLGWPAPERLDLIIELLGLEDEVHRVRADGGTKYGHLISDEHWESDEDASQDEDPPRAEVRSQTVEVLWRSDPDLKYRVHISHGDHRWAPVASHARRAHRLAESNQFDPMGDVDWADLPIPVRERVAEVIAGIDEREDLDPGCRIVNTEGFDRAV